MLAVIIVVTIGVCVLAWIGSRMEPKPGSMAYIRAGGAHWPSPLMGPDPHADVRPNAPPPRVRTMADVVVPGRLVVEECPTAPIPVQRVAPVVEAEPVDPVDPWEAGPLPDTITMPGDITRYGIADDVEIDLAGTPHWLIAGATGTGKSVMLNSILCQMVHRSPDDLQLVLIDPKRVELAPFRDVPHLWRPVATELDDAIRVLRAVETEMDKRYRMLEDNRVRNIDGLARHGVSLPRLVVVADEVGDLMIQAKKRVEPLLMRLTALGRAAGVHVIIATQRPSVDVVTGVLKANLPGRIALRTASGTDSRVILDEVGAEELRLPGEFICRSGLDTMTGRGWLAADEDVDRVTA